MSQGDKKARSHNGAEQTWRNLNAKSADPAAPMSNNRFRQHSNDDGCTWLCCNLMKRMAAVLWLMQGKLPPSLVPGLMKLLVRTGSFEGHKGGLDGLIDSDRASNTSQDAAREFTEPLARQSVQKLHTPLSLPRRKTRRRVEQEVAADDVLSAPAAERERLDQGPCIWPGPAHAALHHQVVPTTQLV